MRYTWQYGAAVAAAVCAAMLAVILVTPAETLGLSMQSKAWLGIAAAGLATLQAFLPRVTSPPNPDRKGVD